MYPHSNASIFLKQKYWGLCVDLSFYISSLNLSYSLSIILNWFNTHVVLYNFYLRLHPSSLRFFFRTICLGRSVFFLIFFWGYCVIKRVEWEWVSELACENVGRWSISFSAIWNNARPWSTWNAISILSTFSSFYYIP